MKKIYLLTLVLFCLLFNNLKAQTEPKLIVESGAHKSVVFDIAVFPDKTKFISASWDKTMRIWDIVTGKLLKTFYTWNGDGQLGQLSAVAISPDGKYIAFGGLMGDGKEAYGKIQIIQTSDYQIISTLIGHQTTVLDLKFSSDSKYLISSSMDIRIWPVKQFKIQKEITNCLILKGHSKEVYAIDIGKDNKKLVSASFDKTALIWELPDKLTIPGELGVGNFKTLAKHTDIIRSVALSPDGKYLVTGGQDRKVYLWDISGNFIKEFFNFGKVGLVRISPDGKKLLVCNAGSNESDADYVPQICTVYSFPEGNMVSTFTQHDGNVAGEFIDDNTVVSGGWKDPAIYIWNISPRKTLQTMKSEGHPIWGVGIDKTNSVGFSFKKNTLFEEPELEKVFNFSGLTVSAVDNQGVFAKSRLSYPNKNIFNRTKYDASFDGIFSNDSINFYCYSFLNDGKVIVGTSNYQLRMFSEKKELMRNYVGHESGVNFIAVSEDNKLMVSSGSDETIRFWSLIEEGLFPAPIEILTHPSWKTYLQNNNWLGIAQLNSKEAWKSLISEIKKSGNINTAKQLENVLPFLASNIRPLVNIRVKPNGDWVAWTPSGYYCCSENSRNDIGWVVNNKTNEFADFISADQLFEKYYRPDIVKKVIKTGIQDTIVIKKLNLISYGANAFNNISDIEIIEPKPDLSDIWGDGQIEVSKRELLIKVAISGEIDEIDEIRLYQNGKLISSTQRGFQPIGKTGNKIVKEYHVTLSNGDNVFKATAFNKQRTEGIPSEIKVNCDCPLFEPASLHMLVIGINEYKNSSYNLNFALPDAQSFFESVKEGAKSIFKNQNVYFLKDKEATKENIIATINSIKNQCKVQDVFVFYYAGHGVMSAQESGRDAVYYLLPHNITQMHGNTSLAENAISGADLLNFSKELKAQKQLFVFDACQSGGAVKAFAVRGAVEEKAMIQLARSSGIMLLSASGTQQYATEFGELGHGVFTYSLLEGLRGEADGGNKDKKITVKELSAYLEDKVPELTEKFRGQAQWPVSYGVGQDFPVVIVNKKD